jgi:hypothetical protein
MRMKKWGVGLRDRLTHGIRSIIQSAMRRRQEHSITFYTHGTLHVWVPEGEMNETTTYTANFQRRRAGAALRKIRLLPIEGDDCRGGWRETTRHHTIALTERHTDRPPALGTILDTGKR